MHVCIAVSYGSHAFLLLRVFPCDTELAASKGPMKRIAVLDWMRVGYLDTISAQLTPAERSPMESPCLAVMQTAARA